MVDHKEAGREGVSWPSVRSGATIDWHSTSEAMTDQPLLSSEEARPDLLAKISGRFPGVEAVFDAALDKVCGSGSDEIQGLFESRLRELLRLQALVAKAQADLAALQEKTPEELALIALAEGHGRRVAAIDFDPHYRPRLPS